METGVFHKLLCQDMMGYTQVPYLAVFFNQNNGNDVIKVYEMKHLNLLKTFCLEDSSFWRVSTNNAFIDDQLPQFHLVGKKELFNREIPPEKTFQMQITIGAILSPVQLYV